MFKDYFMTVIDSSWDKIYFTEVRLMGEVLIRYDISSRDFRDILNFKVI